MDSDYLSEVEFCKSCQLFWVNDLQTYNKCPCIQASISHKFFDPDLLSLTLS